MRRLSIVLFWSVLAAAFIGPGTVTTAATAGSRFGLGLLWTLGFSVVACVVLQEAAARVTVVSGMDLGQAIRARFHGRAGGWPILALVLGTIVLGCAAYQAGNILGAVAGASLGLPFPPAVWTLAVGLSAFAVLWLAASRTVARALGVVVAVMGMAFFSAAFVLRPGPMEIARGLIVPSLPEGSALLVVGLIGTTVVPYNLFLGSGLARGQSLRDIRFGIGVAVVLGGLISMAVVVVGTAVDGPFTYRALADALAERLGAWASGLLALGLFAAGLSSAVTAPLAAALTARGLLSGDRGDLWDERSARFRSVWVGVLLTGVVFGLIDLRPVPAILAAQALNGILLPCVAIFLMIVVNDRAVMGTDGVNGRGGNVAMALTLTVTLVLGISALYRAVSAALSG
jgi:Mn2+/Fe2+ NRAMP family transporter